MATMQTHAETRQRTSHTDGTVDGLWRRRLDLRIDFADSAPVGAIALAIGVPLRILDAFVLDVGDLLRRNGRRGGNRKGAPVAGIRAVCGRIGPRRPPTTTARFARR